MHHQALAAIAVLLRPLKDAEAPPPMRIYSIEELTKAYRHFAERLERAVHHIPAVHRIRKQDLKTVIVEAMPSAFTFGGAFILDLPNGEWIVRQKHGGSLHVNLVEMLKTLNAAHVPLIRHYFDAYVRFHTSLKRVLPYDKVVHWTLMLTDIVSPHRYTSPHHEALREELVPPHFAQLRFLYEKCREYSRYAAKGESAAEGLFSAGVQKLYEIRALEDKLRAIFAIYPF
jgi:hypothetical protein